MGFNVDVSLMSNDLWQLTSRMIDDLRMSVNVTTDDNLYFELRQKNDNRIIGTLRKTYLNHNKTLIYDLRSTSRLHQQERLCERSSVIESSQARNIEPVIAHVSRQLITL